MDNLLRFAVTALVSVMLAIVATLDSVSDSPLSLALLVFGPVLTGLAVMPPGLQPIRFAGYGVTSATIMAVVAGLRNADGQSDSGPALTFLEGALVYIPALFVLTMVLVPLALLVDRQRR